MQCTTRNNLETMDWKNLPDGLVGSILERLLESDYLQFSMVCKSWFSVAKDRRRQRDKMVDCQPPMLLIPIGKSGIWRLYNVMHDKLLGLQLDISKKRFCGSSKGWLIAMDESFTVTLINPFFRVKGVRKKEKSLIPLPRLDPPSWDYTRESSYWASHGNDMVLKATLSADPILNANDCVVVVIFEQLCQLAFMRLKDRKWTYLEDDESWGCIHEAVAIQDKFYAVGYSSKLLSFDTTTTTESSSDVKLLTCELEEERVRKVYLVSSNEKQLLMVHRYIHHDLRCDKRVTITFKVFEFDQENCKWTEKDSLGDIALFLGDNSSIAVLASNYPGCQSNCIYFNHDSEAMVMLEFLDRRPHDFGVYDLKSGRINSVPYGQLVVTLLKKSIWPPIWITPRIQL